MSKGRKRQSQDQRHRFQQQQRQDSNKLEGEREGEELHQQQAPNSEREEAAALMRSTGDRKEEHRLQSIVFSDIDNEQVASAEKKQKMRANCCGSCLSSGQPRPMGGGDEQEGDKTKLAKSRASPRVPSWLIVLMVLVLTTAAVLFAILAYNLLAKVPTCPYNAASKSSYQLHSTKTTYSTVYDYLSSHNDHPTSSSSPQKRVINTSQLGGELPSIFNGSHSLASLNRLLIDQYRCKPVQLHFFGRHASRYPKEDEINKMNKLIKEVQSRIDLSKIEAINQTSQINNTSTSTTTTVTAVSDNATNTVCLNPLTSYKQWRTFMDPKFGNSILDAGVNETRAMGERIKSIFPEMFDQSSADIEFGVTKSERTSQTALIFMKLLENFNFDGCDFQNSHNNNPSSDTTDKHQENQECQKRIEKLAQDKLQFHKTCKEIQKGNKQDPISIKRGVHINESNWNEFIVKSVTKKLKLAKKDALTAEETRAIYDICRYESAFKGVTSIWCSLFEDSELKFYEYRDDIDDFYNQAFGHDYQAQSACQVTVPLLNSFEAALNQQKPSAHFYFTHSEVIQKILAASIDLSEDPAYDPLTIEKHLNDGTVPDTRQWRTSLFTPFSANLAFTLYRCPQDQSPDGIPQLDTSKTHLKVVTSLNEQPIKLDSKRCQDFVCDLADLNPRSRIFKSQDDCNLSKICKDKIIIT